VHYLTLRCFPWSLILGPWSSTLRTVNLTTAGEGLDDSRWHSVRLRSPDGLRLFVAAGRAGWSQPRRTGSHRDAPSSRLFVAVDAGASDSASRRVVVRPDGANTVRLSTGTFVGGLPATVRRRPLDLAVPTVAHEHPLDGSVRRVRRSRCGGSPAETPATLVAGRGISPADRQVEDRCETDSPCLHGGICVNAAAGPLCQCHRTDYDGITCSIGASLAISTHRPTSQELL